MTRPRRHRSVVLLGLGFLLGLGVLFGWLRRHGDAPAAGAGGDVKRLAVLPFDNLGAADDEYFADGVTDEIRGKLASIPGLQVTASRSAAEYKKSGKDLATIARGAGGGLSAGGQGPLGEGRRGAEPGAGESRADPDVHRLHQVGAAVRGQPDGRVPGSGGRGGAGGAGARRGARGGRETGAGRAADAEPGGVRRLSQGRGGVAEPQRRRPTDAAAGDGVLRAGGRTRLEFHRGMGRASAGVLGTLRQRRSRAVHREGGARVRRSRADARARAARRLPRARRVSPQRHGRRRSSAGAGAARPQDRADRRQPPRRRRPGAAAARAAGTRPASCWPRRRPWTPAPSSPAGGSRGACSSAGATTRRPRPASGRSRSIRRISACWSRAP